LLCLLGPAVAIQGDRKVAAPLQSCFIMKIGVVSPEFPPEKGGIQTYAIEFSRELARRGHEVTVFTQPHGEGEMEMRDFRIEPLLRTRWRFDRAIVSRFKMDVWHAMNAAYATLALETPRVFVTVHGNDFLQPYFPVARLDWPRLWGSRVDQRIGDWLTARLVRRGLQRAAHVFTNSRFTEQRFLQQFPQCHGKTSAAMIGVSSVPSSQEVERNASSRDAARGAGVAATPRLITVCRLAEPHKNVHLVLEALALLRASHRFEYTIVGDGYLRPSLEKRSRALGLEDRVKFTGFLDTPALREHLLDSDLFVLPTSMTPVAYEGFGLVYLEANACGCPVLAARIGGAPEAVREGITGMLVDEVTPASLAAALARFLTGAVRYDPHACVEFARTFSWAKVVDHCLARYGSREFTSP
jgi:glycosyltransferase involved in cell wall biosynthesis